MATTKEGLTKSKIVKVLKSYGKDVSYFMPIGGAFGKSGVSDFVCCVRGRFVAIEAKYDKVKNPPTALQNLYMSQVVAAGGVALVIDANNVSMLKDILDEVIKQWS